MFFGLGQSKVKTFLQTSLILVRGIFTGEFLRLGG